MEEVQTRRRSPILGPLRAIMLDGTHEDARGPETIELEVAERMEDILGSFEATKAAVKPAIPVFFKPKAKKDSLQDLVRKQAKIRREQDKQMTILDEEQLRHIWYHIEEFAVHDGDDVKLNYDGFSQLATRCRELYGPQVNIFFKASTFQMFQQDSDGCISASNFATYLGQRSDILYQRIHLSYFDDKETGFLTDFQIEAFIRSMVPELVLLEEMLPNFMDTYTRIAARKFMFFHGKNGKAAIKDLVNSPILRELLELKMSNVRDSQLLSNWFSVQSTQRVYNTFQALDEDMSGMLSRAEFSAISNGTMSPLFINRIFEEHVMQQRDIMGRCTHRDEMDLVAFTDFVLAWDHRSSPAAVRYFFPIFDLEHKGQVSPAELYTFFREIHIMWVDMGEYADLEIYHVVDEILDMIQPKKPPIITAEDLLVSKQSGIFFQMLADVKQFSDYNYRENFIHQNDDEGQ